MASILPRYLICNLLTYCCACFVFTLQNDILSQYTKNHVRGFLCNSGDRIRTCDLQVMSLTSYQTALPRNRGENYTRFQPNLYPQPIERVVNRFQMHFDFGWLFLLAGCALLCAALTLPAKQELKSLKEKLNFIETENDHLAQRINQYQAFFDAMNRKDAQLLARVISMQTTGYPIGNFIVFDPNAAKTPLEWLQRRTTQEYTAVKKPGKQSILVRVTSDDRRLWVAGFSGLIIFFGLVQSPRREY